MKSELANKLKDLLDNMSQEDFDKTWNDITSLELDGPSIQQTKIYTEEEVRLILIYCVSELVTHPKMTSSEMKVWNEKTHQWFDNYLNKQ